MPSDQDFMLTMVQASLVSTPYECTELIRVLEAKSNFVYRGTLSQPLSDGTTVIIVKHTENYLVSNKRFELAATRAFYESQFLSHLSALPVQSLPGTNITITTPHLYYYHATTYTQILSHHPSLTDCIDLKSYVIRHGNSLTTPMCQNIGRSLGHWLKAFHTWANEPTGPRVALRDLMGGNGVMKSLSLQLHYKIVVRLIDELPELLGDSREVFVQVRDDTMRWMESGGEGTRELIHGEFCGGNVLLPNKLLDTTVPTPIFITDFEISHLSTTVFDLGKMCADIYTFTTFGSRSVRGILPAFMQGYGELDADKSIDEEKRWRVLIHIGVYLVCWACQMTHSATKKAVVEYGRDLVTKGWKKDREWCRSQGWEMILGTVE